MHTHKCGYDGMRFDPHAGCGHEWSHEDSCILLPTKEFKRAHRCANCGRGPWNHKYRWDEKSTVQSLNRMVDSLFRALNTKRKHE